MTEVLKTLDLSIGYDKKILANDVNVTLTEGDFIAIIGPNGAGKSTLFKTLSGTLNPIHGDILMFGKSIKSYTPKERATMLSIVLTSRPDDMFMRVYDVVAAGRFSYTNMFGKLQEKDKNIIKESLEIIGIKSLESRYFNTLSDGEKQKVMIAKAIAQDTPLILLDEPTSFLDYPSKIELFGIMKMLTEEKKKTILFSSHDLELLLRYTMKIWMLAPDKPFISGKTESLLNDGIIRKYFNLESNEYLAYNPENKFVKH